jgi:pimeloyl-ACP methyl ester carboxylesterase
MDTMKSATLRVPRANLYYEVRGSGPLLLMITGGGGGGGGDWNGFVNHFTDSYTVVTYDRRGSLRSTLDDPTEDVTLETHSDDAHLLLTTLTTEPAYIFGSSAGALIGLDLVAQHSEQVRTLVAHEPPAHYLLPDAAQSQQDPLEVYRREGGLAALKQYVAQVGVNYESREAGVELPQRSPEGTSNADALFKYTMLAVRRYRLNVPALLAAPTRIVIAAASAGREFVGYRCAAAVANQLQTTLVEFPGHHAGYISHPGAFAARLHAVLRDEQN